MFRQTTDRRSFLCGSSALALGAWAPSRLLFAKTRKAANDRLAVGIIGCGKMAADYHLPELLKQPDVQLVAVCEVERSRRERFQQRVNQFYSDSKKTFRGCDGIVDYREMLSRDDIDAVCIATPDHWHALPLIQACQAGKDVYCEKPLTHSLQEAKLCIDAARKHDRVVQVGSQQRSNVFGPFRQAVEFIQSGRLGKIHKVTVGVGGPSIPCDLPAEKLEPGLDWDLWQGPATERPFHSVLCPRGMHTHFPQWRKYRAYSGGGHTDMGAHHYDIANWALGLDHTGPIEIIPPEQPEKGVGVRYLYENGLEIEHGGPGGCVFHGEKGTLHINRGLLKSDPEAIVKTPLAADEIHLPVSPGHHRNWLDCIVSRAKPVADVEFGARTVAAIHLGNLAYGNGRSFRWDPQAWQFKDPSDNRFLSPERRDPWQLPKV